MKTIEEAAQEFANNAVPSLIKEPAAEILRKAYREGFEGGVEYAQRWIPVEEELPEPSFTELVLVKGFYEDKNYGRLKFLRVSRLRSIHKGNALWIGLTDKIKSKYTVTHWRPIEMK